MIGAIAGGGKGLAIGAGVGALTGAIAGRVKKGHEVKVKSRTEFGVVLNRGFSWHIANATESCHTMRSRHRIFVSVENNAYCGWQSKLFYFSSVTRLNRKPTFIVHDSGGGWHPDFYDLASAGATVVTAPSYIQSVRDTYKPRNTAGSLIHAAEMCDKNDLIVLCDPDMIFLDEPKLPKSLSVNFYFYMDYDRAEVKAAMRKLKIPISKVEHQKEELRGGVPYVIPARVARHLGTVWLEAVDAFVPRHWIDIMHAFGLAVAMLGLKVTRTDVVDVNLKQLARARRKMIHYCYGDDIWEKRWFVTDDDAPGVWSSRASAKKGTILGELLGQIIEAKQFYQNLSMTADESSLIFSATNPALIDPLCQTIRRHW